MINIRTLTTIEEMEAVYELETRIWETEIVPPHQTITVVRNGGLMLGAYDGEKLIGFSYSFPGFANDERYLCSHMLGIHPDYRSRGIGRQLKEVQLKTARSMGYKKITWTFDPLETRNAYLNLSKLRGISNTYIENCYGSLADGLNKGLPTDRLEISWYIDSPYVNSQAEIYDEGTVIDLNTIKSVGEFLVPDETVIPQKWDEDACYGLSLFPTFQAMKEIAPTLAYEWRLYIRKQFQHLFTNGFVVIGLERTEAKNRYIFMHHSKIQLI